MTARERIPFLATPPFHRRHHISHAEQSLRLPVIFRKICFGNRSVAGAQTLSVNLLLLTTAKRQARDPLAFLQALLLRGPSTAQPLLYRNSLPDTS